MAEVAAPDPLFPGLAPKADVEACQGFSADSTTLNFLSCAASKNDNFKVGEVVPVLTPAIHVEKTADPTSLPIGGGEVTYTYEVTNAGDAVLSNVTVDDDTCSPVDYVSGDTNGDTKLDLHETWVFECTMTITDDTTNTAVAHGWFIETEVTDDDTADVVVADPTARPVVTPPVVTPPPSQSVLAETGTPNVTAPPTDSIGGPAAPTQDTWRLMLVLLAAALASLLVLTPAPARRRR